MKASLLAFMTIQVNHFRMIGQKLILAWFQSIIFA